MPDPDAHAKALWLRYLDQQGYPNGLPTWDELPEIDQEMLRQIASLPPAPPDSPRQPDP